MTNNVDVYISSYVSKAESRRLSCSSSPNDKSEFDSGYAPTASSDMMTTRLSFKTISRFFRSRRLFNNNVLDLKKLIHQERKNAVLRSVDAVDLVLLKVDIRVSRFQCKDFGLLYHLPAQMFSTFSSC